MSNLQSELATCRAHLDGLDIAKYQADFDAAQKRLAAMPSVYKQTNELECRARRDAENDLSRARHLLEVVTNEAHAPKTRIAEIERIMGADARIKKANKQIDEATATLGNLAATQNLIDAALAKLISMKADTEARVQNSASASADKLLLDAGLPGLDLGGVDAIDTAMAQQELASITVAIQKANARKAECTQAMQAADTDLAQAQAELLDATADKLAQVHATALAAYLPHLAALRGAELAARGHTSHRVDAELLAAEINRTAQENQ